MGKYRYLKGDYLNLAAGAEMVLVLYKGDEV